MSLRPGRGRRLAMLFVPLLLLVDATPGAAQYFGRQKVQYERFDWRIMETEKFDIHFYPAEREVTEDAARMAERWYARLTRAFQHEFEKKPLIFYADHPDFQQTNTTSGMLTEGTGGFTEALRNRVVMPFTGVYHENDHVLGHELVHVFQYDLASPVKFPCSSKNYSSDSRASARYQNNGGCSALRPYAVDSPSAPKSQCPRDQP
jgi:hypothetical protein